MVNLRECKIIVLARLQDGDEVTVSVKSTDKPLVESDKFKLVDKISREIVPLLEDTIYYTIRASFFGKKNNWKVKSLKELHNVIETLF